MIARITRISLVLPKPILPNRRQSVKHYSTFLSQQNDNKIEMSPIMGTSKGVFYGKRGIEDESKRAGQAADTGGRIMVTAAKAEEIPELEGEERTPWRDGTDGWVDSRLV
jgi:hypothetical protein